MCTSETPASFEEFGLPDELLRGIYEYGFETPSRIQSQCIPIMTSGRDLIAQSHSGTGKTAAFCIGALGRLDAGADALQIIIVTPTKELAMQIQSVCAALGRHLLDEVALMIGGNMYTSANTASVVVGTPGKLIHTINSRILKLDALRLLVIDEVDEMLSSSLLEQTKQIIQRVPCSAQLCVFSATLSKRVLELTKRFMREPERILVERENLTLQGIRQCYVNTTETAKYDELCALYANFPIAQSIVYVNTIVRAEKLCARMRQGGHSVEFIHGSMDGGERSSVVREFRNGKFRVLVSTDLLSRGIDIQLISVVINYDVPDSPETYLHRIGRSGRFGKEGLAITMVTPFDSQSVAGIESYFSTKLELY